MVNHFATLLINLDLKEVEAYRERYLLANNLNLLIVGEEENNQTFNISLGDYYTELEYISKVSLYINRNFKKVFLPGALLNFYELLFPSNSSFQYKHFLLYSCLRVIAATDLHENVDNYDNRRTYVLDNQLDYFKFHKITVSNSNFNDYDILVSGQIDNPIDLQDTSNSFVVRQLGYSENVTVFSTTQKQYYRQGKAPAKTSNNMNISLNWLGNSTAQIPVGDTGLKFSLTGSRANFQDTSNKHWRFTAQAPFNFNLRALLDLFKAKETVVYSMLDYMHDECDASYSNLWNTHYNDVYRFAGLIMAYVERVNKVWLQNLG
jgi:hypothetical protein